RQDHEADALVILAPSQDRADRAIAGAPTAQANRWEGDPRFFFRFLEQFAKRGRVSEGPGIGRRAGTQRDGYARTLADPRYRPLGDPARPVEVDQQRRRTILGEALWEKERPQTELFAPALERFVLQALVGAGMLHHGRGILSARLVSPRGVQRQERP